MTHTSIEILLERLRSADRKLDDLSVVEYLEITGSGAFGKAAVDDELIVRCIEQCRDRGVLYRSLLKHQEQHSLEEETAKRLVRKELAKVISSCGVVSGTVRDGNKLLGKIYTKCTDIRRYILSELCSTLMVSQCFVNTGNLAEVICQECLAASSGLAECLFVAEALVEAALSQETCLISEFIQAVSRQGSEISRKLLEQFLSISDKYLKGVNQMEGIPPSPQGECKERLFRVHCVAVVALLSISGPEGPKGTTTQWVASIGQLARRASRPGIRKLAAKCIGDILRKRSEIFLVEILLSLVASEEESPAVRQTAAESLGGVEDLIGNRIWRRRLIQVLLTGTCPTGLGSTIRRVLATAVEGAQEEGLYEVSVVCGLDKRVLEVWRKTVTWTGDRVIWLIRYLDSVDDWKASEAVKALLRVIWAEGLKCEDISASVRVLTRAAECGILAGVVSREEVLMTVLEVGVNGGVLGDLLGLLAKLTGDYDERTNQRLLTEVLVPACLGSTSGVVVARAARLIGNLCSRKYVETPELLGALVDRQLEEMRTSEGQDISRCVCIVGGAVEEWKNDIVGEKVARELEILGKKRSEIIMMGFPFFLAGHRKYIDYFLPFWEAGLKSGNFRSPEGIWYVLEKSRGDEDKGIDVSGKIARLYESLISYLLSGAKGAAALRCLDVLVRDGVVHPGRATVAALRVVVAGEVVDGRVALGILKKISEKNSIISGLAEVLRSRRPGGVSSFEVWRGYVEILKKREVVEVGRKLVSEMKLGNIPAICSIYFQMLKFPAEEKSALMAEGEAALTSLVSMGDGDERSVRSCVALSAAKEYVKSGVRTSEAEFETHVQRILKKPSEGLLELCETGIPKNKSVRAKRLKTPVRKRRRTLGLTQRERNGEDEDEVDDDEDW